MSDEQGRKATPEELKEAARKRIWADDAGVPRVLSPEETAEIDAILAREEEEERKKKGQT